MKDGWRMRRRKAGFPGGGGTETHLDEMGSKEENSSELVDLMGKRRAYTERNGGKEGE